MFTGKCLCGVVTYQAIGSPVVVAQCHCEKCRRLSGTGHSVGAMFPAAAVTVRGPLKEFKYMSDLGSEVTKDTCAVCASPILGRNSRTPDHVTLTLGSMDDAAGLAVQVVVFDRDTQHWDHLEPDVATYPSQPDWSPDR